jgi:hypothetical protein
MLKFLLFTFRQLGTFTRIFFIGQDSADLVQTAATFGGLYKPIPNDEGERRSQIEAVE